MSTRTTQTTVTFRRPFTISGVDGMQPAGRYAIETDEELLQGISFPAYRRVQTLIHLHAAPGQSGISQTVMVDPEELDAALARDALAVRLPLGGGR
jgi:hypothetical protein